ncbi:MAG: hypothetical protein JRE40_06685 [Deltaproteobacteria bacterium]|nr:hypothetical protein [Deltaproteobacteria bacterium]
MRKPYSFRFERLPEDCSAYAHGSRFIYNCEKQVGNMQGHGGPCVSWEQAVTAWQSVMKSWTEYDDYLKVWPPCIPSNVDFTDHTGEHSVQELFGMVRLL